MIPAPGLALGSAPPLSVPMRYFATAPAFAAGAGAVIALGGPDALATRWSPALLAAVHLLTLGFATTVMVGALSQVVPVLAGVSIPFPRLVAGLVHPALAAGALALPVGLALDPSWLPAAAAVLGLALAGFAATLLAVLARAPARGPTVQAIRLAATALIVTAGLGALLAAARTGRVALPPGLTDVHAGWGLLGWVAVLVAGVAYQVVPMFQLTPAYPRALRRLLAPALVVGLAAWSAHPWWGAWPAGAIELALLALMAAFALATLGVQARRRRRVADATLLYWRLAMACVLAAVALRGLALGWPGAPARLTVATGVLALVGAMQGAINGMLYKIVPFLVWLHLRGAGHRAVTMAAVVPDRAARRQLGLHLAALAALLVAVAWPAAAPAAGLLYAAANLLVLGHVAGAVAFYRRRSRAAPPPAGDPPPRA